MPALSLNQAAKAAKRSKTRILNDLNNGRLSGKKDESGHWQIDAAELFRVYPPNQSITSPVTGDKIQSDTSDKNHYETDETTLLRQQITLLGLERDRERQQLQSTIDDLRKRLDRADDERIKLTALITHQKTSPETAQKSPTSRTLVFLVLTLVAVAVMSVLALRFGWID